MSKFKRMKWILITCLVSVFILPVRAQSLLDVSTGNRSTLSELIGTAWAVIIFTDQECAYDLEYLGRVKALAAKYPGVRFIRINTLDKWEDTPSTMKSFAQSKGIKSAYFYDETGESARLLEARKSTQAILLRWREGPVIAYTGAIDSNPLRSDDVRSHYLEDAITEALAGKKISRSKTLVTGCMIDR